MIRLLYSFSITLYHLSIRIFALFNNKAHLWVKGRKSIFKHIQSAIGEQKNIIWFHAASLGEFEQGRPVIDAVRKQHPDYKILLTFFSPSGYEVRKNFEGADFIFYLPMDSRRNARRFVKFVNPALAVFIKYEFWFNYLIELRKKNIPAVFTSVIFRPDQHFFKWYGDWFRRQLKHVYWFFVQNEQSVNLLRGIGVNNVSISGDTRFDRVFEAAAGKKSFPEIEKFVGHSKIVLAGSTWPQDEEMLIGIINKNEAGVKYIIAPHEIHAERIAHFATRVQLKTICYSSAASDDYADAQVLIIDSIGILLHLYQYATVAYIGGGFGKNIHNILEAATFGKPVIFGPNHHKFQEAKDLLAVSGAFCIANQGELSCTIEMLFTMEAFYNNSSTACSDYVRKRIGATAIIMKKLDEVLMG
ncbi:MAG: glycosyltransferase N-terminal domain-containing protein [Bacteroidota bacterium]